MTSMRILFLNQFFWPDAAPTAHLLGDVCRELVARGHRVEVLCGKSDYEGTTDSPVPPVTVHRIGNLPFSRGSAARLMSWISFLLLAAAKLIRLPRYDLVVAMTTPPGLAWAGWLGRWWRGSRFWIWEMDLYPDVAVATGAVSERSVATRLIALLINWPRRRADGIIALGECMRDRLRAHGLAAEKVVVAENWVDGSSVLATPLPASRPLNVFYSGNLGMAHEIDTILEAMDRLRDDDIRFTFAGGGARFAELLDRCRQRGLRNVEFLPYGRPEEFGERLAGCHLGLVTLRPGCEGTVVPSKFYGLLAAGRPCLFIGAAAATPARHIRELGCGWHRDAGDVGGTVELLRRLLSDPRLLQDAAAETRAVFERSFDRPRGVDRVCRLLVGADRSGPAEGT